MPGTPVYVGNSDGMWSASIPSYYNDTAADWTTDQMEAEPAVFKGSLFYPYIAQGTVFTRDVTGTNMPIDSNSATYAAWMAANENWTPGGGFGGTSLNLSSQNTQPIEVYVVDSTVPGCEFQYVDSCGGAQYGTAEYLTGRIPWPSWAVPAQNGDYGMAIYDMGTGIMREYFYVQPAAQAGHWTVSSGGWSLANQYFRDLGTTNYPLQLRTGSSAVVMMHNPLGFIGIADVLKGSIDHAICYTTSQMQQGTSWPAKQADGTYTGTDAPVEGQWCRLPSSVNPDDYNPLTGMIIKAAQTYGMVATDKNLFVHAFNGEGHRTFEHFYGINPWYKHPSDATGASDGPCIQALTLMNNGDRNNLLTVNDFPWDLTEWAPVDWGRPNPDFDMRPTQYNPYWQ